MGHWEKSGCEHAGSFVLRKGGREDAGVTAASPGDRKLGMKPACSLISPFFTRPLLWEVACQTGFEMAAALFGYLPIFPTSSPQGTLTLRAPQGEQTLS